MEINTIHKEIVKVTQLTINNGLSVIEKYPITIGNKITWSGQNDISKSLKNIPYLDKYKTLEKDKNFNLKMVDGGLIQMMYEFTNNGKELSAHRLAYFPRPLMYTYDENPIEYEESYFGNSEFHDLIEKNTTSFPIRFDYNASDKIFIEIDHPYSHVTFGEFKNCRIPVNSPLSPSIFMNFIIRNFYNYAFKKKGVFCEISKIRYTDTITPKESNTLHFNIK